MQHQKAGERVMDSVTSFVERKLKLKVNRAKSAVARPSGASLMHAAITNERLFQWGLESLLGRWRGLSRVA